MKKMASYIAILRKDPDSDYGVDFPDFPGCIAVGSTLDEARMMAAEALDFHVDGMIEDGDAIPEPSSLEAVKSDPAHRDGVAILVDLPRKPNPSIRVNVMLPQDIIEAIDRVTNNRSRFLAEAARDRLARAAIPKFAPVGGTAKRISES
jgi:predicted RNase H-like HicB family nuclease